MNVRERKRLALLERMPKGGVCAEIGVWDGAFSEQILAVTEPRRLHLIDPWEFQPEFGNSAFGRDAHRDQMQAKYESVRDRFADDDRVVIHRAYSHDALAALEDASLDWVYIDGNHSFEVVSKDIEICLSKVKPDGVIAGDDLHWMADQGAPVRKAVWRAVKSLGDAVTFDRIGQQYILNLARA